jgi:hypothetical protein
MHFASAGGCAIAYTAAQRRLAMAIILPHCSYFGRQFCLAIAGRKNFRARCPGMRRLIRHTRRRTFERSMMRLPFTPSATAASKSPRSGRLPRLWL